MASKKKLQNQVAAATAEARVAASTAVELETRNAGLEVALAAASARLAAPPPPAPAAPAAAPPPAPPPPPPATPRLEAWDRLKSASELERGQFLAEHGDELRREADAKAAHAKSLQTSAAPPAAPPGAAPPAQPRAADGTFAPPASPVAPGAPVDHKAVYADLQTRSPYLAAQYLLEHELAIHPSLAQPFRSAGR